LGGLGNCYQQGKGCGGNVSANLPLFPMVAVFGFPRFTHHGYNRYIFTGFGL
jgi:hypothetical protein